LARAAPNSSGLINLMRLKSFVTPIPHATLSADSLGAKDRGYARLDCVGLASVDFVSVKFG
jgi:hypothetical protein